MERQSKDSSLQPGTVIDGKYEVRRVLGSGAMGAVVEATHLLRRARVALKFMSQGMADRPGIVERFLNEGIAASRINNEHVVKVLDVSRLPNGQPYIVMEFLDGEDLANLLTREGEHGLVDPQRAVHFILQVLRGLQVAHGVGIIHRDLKPANCFVVNNDGEPDFIKIVDFGISKVQEADTTLALTSEGATMGTPLYVSPEQARDATSVDARSDLYSVAAMLYELLSGRTPFDAPTLAGLFMQLAIATPKPLHELRAGLHPGLAEVVQKGLAKAPEDRFQSAAEMAWALAPFADARSEVTLRQMMQRPSLHAGHASQSSLGGSSVPPGTAVPVPRAPRVAHFGAESRGTAPGVVRVSGREAAEARTVVRKDGSGAKGLVIALSVLVVLGLGGGIAYVMQARTAEQPNSAGAEEPSGAARMTRTDPSPPAVDTVTAAPAASTSASAATSADRPPEPRAPVTAPVAAARHGSSAAGGARALSSATSVSAGGRGTHPPPAETPSNRKPALSNIGLQD